MKKVLFLVFILVQSAYASSESYDIKVVQFKSHDVTLEGSIVFPEKGMEIVSAVIFVHGSGKQQRNLHIAKQFASEGVVALVYDKRGAGNSGGEYEGNQSVSEKNITLLADDAAAAFAALRRHPRVQGVPIGLTGISQAGWIVPLAAVRSGGVADFIVLWSSPVCKVSEEDIFSKYTADIDRDRVPSYSEALNSRKRKYVWPDFLGLDTNPSDSLATLAIPGLWIFGGNDGSIPVDLSIDRLQKQIDQGGKYNYVLFSSLGHNNIPETFATAVDWIKRVSSKRS